MAQAGFTPLQLYYSATTTNVPLAGSLAFGELAINITDGKLFYKDNANVIQVIGYKLWPMTSVTGVLAIANGGTGASTLAAASIPTFSSTSTLTNKRITQRVNAQTTTTSPWAWNSDSYDQQSFSALANALTISADAGTPTDGQKTVFRFKDNGTVQALTWTTGTAKSFRSIGVALPVATVIGKTLYVGCIYNTLDSRWDAVAVAQEA
jgi:hypothetical protein